MKKVLKSAFGLEVVVSVIALVREKVQEDQPTQQDQDLNEKSGPDLLMEKLGATKIDEFEEGGR